MNEEKSSAILTNKEVAKDSSMDKESGLKKEEQEEISTFAKVIYLIGGFISLTLGIIGIVLPILPTTPFLLLAAGCFARSSERCHDWLLNNRIFGSYIRNYKEGKGMPLKVKAFTIFMLWLTILLSIFLFIETSWVEILLLVIAIAVTIHIVLIRPKNPKEKH